MPGASSKTHSLLVSRQRLHGALSGPSHFIFDRRCSSSRQEGCYRGMERHGDARRSCRPSWTEACQERHCLCPCLTSHSPHSASRWGSRSLLRSFPVLERSLLESEEAGAEGSSSWAW